MDFNVLLGISCVCSLLIQQTGWCITILLAMNETDQCISTNDGRSLPSFRDHDSRDIGQINRFYQAITPSYQLQCCGEIRAWGVDVHPHGGHDQKQYTLNLQVWRPSPTVDDQTGRGHYSLVGNNRFSAISLSGGVAEVTPSPQDYIQFQPGDVLGFYVEEASDDNFRGVAVLTINGYTNELVWLASATSRAVGCPISVGSGGDLNTTLQGAPVISISTGTISCPQILPTPPPCPFTSPPTTNIAIEEPTKAEPTNEQPTTNEPTMIANENELVTDSEGFSTNTDEAMIDDLLETQGGFSQPLLIGIVAAILVVGILISLTILVSVLICKKRSKSFDVTQTSLQLGVTNRLHDQGIGDNSDTVEAEQTEAYGVTGGESGDQEMATYTAESMYSYPIVDPDQSIEANRNDAYATCIVTEKNEAYKPVRATSVSETADEYDYI